MSKIVYKLVFNRKGRLNKRGTALVQVEAYQDKRRKYFSTQVYLQPGQWDQRQQAVKRHPNGEALTFFVHDFLNRLERTELELWQHGRKVTLQSLQDAFSTDKRDYGSFYDFYRQEVEGRLALRESTQRNHLTTLQVLKRFRAEVCFDEVDFGFVTDFGHFLQQEGYHINTIAKHMKHLKRYVNLAIDKEHISLQGYAFRKYRIKTAEGHHTHLTPEELERLERLRLSGRRLRYSQTLDAFLFCCYTGLRYSDFVRLTPESFVTVGEEMWLVYRSQKTGTEVRLPLRLMFDGKAIELLESHRDGMEEFFRLKGNPNVNKELLRLGRMARIDKHISFHTARHTTATLLIYKGVNITTVQKLLGHRSVKTTQIYAGVMDRTLMHDLESNR